MNEDVTVGSPLPSGPKGLTHTLLFVTLLILVLGASIFWLFSLQERTVPEADPEGYIYLTLYPKVRDSGVDHPTVARLGINTGSVEYLTNSDITITADVLPTTGRLVFASIPFSEHESEHLQIWTQDSEGHDKAQITNSSSLYKRTPRWSPDGQQIAFAAIANPQSNALVPNNWNVFLTDLAGNEEFIAKGANPYFTPDGSHLLILKDEGLALVDILSKDETVVWETEGGAATLSMSFGVSDDGAWLAWPDVVAQKILIVRIDNWSSFSAEVVYTIPMYGVWPVFSPDSRYVAFQNIDMASTALDAEKPHRLVIFDLLTQQIVDSFSLDFNYADKTFVTDWAN